MINNLVLAGRLTADPESRETNGGTLTTFKLAVDRQFAKDGDQQADFFNCVAFGKTAENVAQYCDRGMPVAVEGRVQIDQVEKDGHTNYYTKVVANNVRFLETKAQAEARRAAAGKSAQTAGEMDDPFGDQ